MSDAKYTAVVRYLHVHFPNRDILQHYDFDRGAQSFKVVLDRDTLLLKVTDTLLEDNQVDEIARLLDRMAAAEALGRTLGTNEGILVTSAGLRTFDRG